jgi:hypothetical protein
MTDLRIPKTGGSESNPFRPDLPQDIRNISESLFSFMREQVGNLRRQHNATQGGDSTFSWELLTEPEDAPQFTLGSLGRFFHHTYGLILARYVQFADMDHAGEWSGVPLGYHHSQAPFMWRVTNDLTKSRNDLAMGVMGPYVIPQDGQFGWMIVNGVNIQALLSSSIPVRFARFSWKQTSRVELVGEHSGPPIARIFGDQWIPRGDGPWWIPPGQAYIDTLTLNEAASVNGFDSIGVEDQIQQLQDLVANTRFEVDYQLDQSSVELQTAREGINLTAKMLQRRMASLGLDSIRQEMQETLQATVTAQNLALTAADNSGAAALITHANLVATNDFKRTAEVSATDAGIFANSATEASNTATLNANESTLQAQAAATSASNAAVSETNAGTSATAAQTSATNAATSAGAAATSAGTASTQASNAATSATNAAGSASNAASSATTATNAATTATTQAGNAATGASNASTYASNASTSATQASTSATNAGTSATNASNSATASAASAVAASSSASGAALSLARTFPEQVDAVASGYTLATSGTDSAATDIAGATIVSVGGRYEIRDTNTISQKGLLAALTGRVYEVVCEFNVATYTSGTVTLACGLRGLDSAFATIAATAGNLSVTAAGTYKLTQRFSDTANATRNIIAWPAASVWLRPRASWSQSGSGCVVDLRGIAIRDVTSTVTSENQADAAATSASNASTSATAAGTSATAASTSATNASTSATNAANSASTATTQAGNASTSASAASTSASNALSSANSASTSATTASNSATTATTQAGIATTQASNASTSASNASTSATSASGSASSASTSATAAASSSTSALGVARSLLPSDFSNAKFWTRQYTADETAADLSCNFPVVTGIGVVAETVGPPSGSTASEIANKGFMPVVPNRTYRVTAKIRMTVNPSSGGARTGAEVLAYNADKSYAGATPGSALAAGSYGVTKAVDSTLTVADGWHIFGWEYASGATPAYSYIRAYCYSNFISGNGTSQVAYLKIEDVTDQKNAESSATASNTSATSAATSATSAGTSASTATTQASNSATSASNAATSATAAATSATNASTSAANASTSATLAAQAGIGSLNANPNFSDWPAGNAAPTSWSNTYPAGITTSNSTRVAGDLGGYAWRVAVAAGVDNVYGSALVPEALIRKLQCVVEIDITLNSGSLVGAGVGLAWNSTTIIAYSTAIPVGAAAAPGAGVAGKTYRYRVPYTVPDTASSFSSSLVIQPFFHWSGVGSVAAAIDITLKLVSIRPVSDMEAAVLSSTGVTVDVASRIATASFETVTVAGSATAALRINSKAIGGSASSSVAIEGEEIQLFSNALGVRALGLKMTSSGVLVTGDLDVGKGVKIGSRRIPVALQSFQVTAKDGDAVDFGTDLGNTPVLLFDTSHLAPKTAAQTYDVRATSLTSTGFTMYAKITTPSSPTTNTMSTSNDAGAGVTPRYQIEKSVTPDAYDGNYTFSVQLTVTFTDNGDGSASGYAEYDCYVRSAGAWVFAGTISKNIVKASPSGSFSRNVQGVINFAGAIGQDAGGTKEFGIVVVAGLFTAFNSVTFLSTSTSGTSSASPSGELVTVTVIPQNV